MWVLANGDKPHRCPRCHCIPDKARAHGRTRLWATYRCESCDVSWWKGLNDFTWRDRLWVWRRRTVNTVERWARRLGI